MQTEYARVLTLQNQGKPCPHCESPFGHYNVCPLLNRNVAEARAAEGLNKPDVDFLKALRIVWS